MTDFDFKTFPSPPIKTEPLRVTEPNPSVRAFLSRRRSASKRHLIEPGPSPTELDELLYVASRVPDHRKLGPWRYIVFEGAARASFGETIAEIFKLRTPGATDKQIEEERSRFLRAPTVVAIVSSPVDDGRTPVWEQELSVGALCYNLLLAASASGWANVWLTEWLAFDRDVADAMGLSETERLAGIVYLGTCVMLQPERPRPDIAPRIQRWEA